MEVNTSAFVWQGKTLICGVYRDITERKKAETALQKNERELSDFFGKSPLGLLWVNPQGIILRANQAQLDLLECAEKKVLGQPVRQFWADFEKISELLDRLARGETVRDFRTRLKGGNGLHVLIDANGLWDQGRLIHSRWFVRDITRQIEMEREILSISEREQQRIAQDLHDDLCQQLSGIHFLTHTLARRLADTSRAEGAEAAKIAESVRDALEKTRELSRGLSPMTVEADSLAAAFQRLCARIENMFRRKCVFHGQSSILLPAPGAGIHLYRIAQEAVNNAVRHGQASRIDITLAAKRDKLILKIRDNGRGLPLRPENGKGMGLRVMQYRASMLGGSLVVQQATAGGTEVVCSVAAKKRLTPAGKAG